MSSLIFVENRSLRNTFHNSMLLSDFIDIFEHVRDKSYKFITCDGEQLNELYMELYAEFRKTEEYQLFSSALERYTLVTDSANFQQLLDEFSQNCEQESNELKRILLNENKFNFLYPHLKYHSDVNVLRCVSNTNDLKKCEVLFATNIQNVDQFVEEIKKIFRNMIFDNNISSGIHLLNDGFHQRRKEICYHLFCIDDEIPEIVNNGINSYIEIGTRLTLDCSPERSRETKANELTCIFNGIELNCELHTKMKKLSSKAPDRIYFCPYINVENDLYKGKIYIYKITAHV